MNTDTNNNHNHVNYEPRDPRADLEEAHNRLRNEYCSIVNGRVYTVPEYTGEDPLWRLEFGTDNFTEFW